MLEDILMEFLVEKIHKMRYHVTGNNQDGDLIDYKFDTEQEADAFCKGFYNNGTCDYDQGDVKISEVEK